MLIRSLTLVSLVSLLAGCNTEAGYNSIYREAGLIDNGADFGNSTMQNTLVMTGAAAYAVNLNNRFVAQVPTTINFAFNSYVLDEDARATLRAQADFMRQFPEVRFKVFGHTDLVGSSGYNRTLGLRRAEAAVLYLQTQGIQRSRLEAVVSYGETQPLIVTEGRERANRRTVTEVTGFVNSNPIVMNGKYAEIIFRDYVASAAVAPTLSASNLTSAGE